MIVYENNKEYRNLQEQVEKNKDDIERIKNGIVISFDVDATAQLSALMTEENIGKYVYHTGEEHLYVITRRNSTSGIDAVDLGKYPVAAPGQTGPKGDTGNTGPKGNSLYSGASLPEPGSYNEGDMFLVSAGNNKGNIYKKVGRNWTAICNVIGPEGPIGPEGTSVEANPTGSATGGALNKILICGSIYSVNSLTEEQADLVDALLENVEIDEDGNADFGHNVYADGDLEAGRYLILTGADAIQDEEGNELVQKKLIAGTNIIINDDGTISASSEPQADVYFDNILQRPKYGGSTMTHNTNIPVVPTKTSDLTNDSNFVNSSQIANVERTTNRVELSTSVRPTSSAAYPTAQSVYDRLANIREVAEGKCKVYVISYNDTYNESYVGRYIDKNGNTLTQAQIEAFIENKELKNTYFNSQNNHFSLPIYSGYYFILRKGLQFILIASDDWSDLFKPGDEVFVIETNVPDRWFDNGSLYALETTKVDLTNYLTRAEASDTYATLSNVVDEFDPTATEEELHSLIPNAKCINDLVGSINTALDTINGEVI